MALVLTAFGLSYLLVHRTRRQEIAPVEEEIPAWKKRREEDIDESSWEMIVDTFSRKGVEDEHIAHAQTTLFVLMQKSWSFIARLSMEDEIVERVLEDLAHKEKERRATALNIAIAATTPLTKKVTKNGRPRSVASIFVEHGVLEAIKPLLHDTDMKIREEACLLVQNMVSGDESKAVNTMLKNGTIEALMAELEKGAMSMRREALVLMDLIVEHRFTEVVRACMKMGLLEIAIDFAKEKIEENTLKMCIDVLEMLVDICTEEKAAARSGDSRDRALSEGDAVRSYFTEAKVDSLLELFQKLKGHHNGDVAQHGYHLVDKLEFIKSGRHSISDSVKEPSKGDIKKEIAKHLQVFRKRAKEVMPMQISATALAAIVSNPKNAEHFRTVENVQLLVHILLRDWNPQTEELVATLLLLLGICIRPKAIKKQTER